jgi:hypothetical protein
MFPTVIFVWKVVTFTHNLYLKPTQHSFSITYRECNNTEVFGHTELILAFNNHIDTPHM